MNKNTKDSLFEFLEQLRTFSSKVALESSEGVRVSEKYLRDRIDSLEKALQSDETIL